jgi:hypothetical protein
MMGHLLRVTSDDAGDPDERYGEIICPSVTSACRVWWECSEAGCQDTETIDSIDDGQDIRHRVEHQVIDDLVMTPGTQCIGKVPGDAMDAAHDAAEGLAPGDYPCEITYGDDGYLDIAVVTR